MGICSENGLVSISPAMSVAVLANVHGQTGMWISYDTALGSAVGGAESGSQLLILESQSLSLKISLAPLDLEDCLLVTLGGNVSRSSSAGSNSFSPSSLLQRRSGGCCEVSSR